jgi:hypothetical protein
MGEGEQKNATPDYAALRAVQAQYADTYERLQILRRELAKDEQEKADKRLTRWKDRATILGVCVAIFALSVASLTYLDNERAKKLERTYSLLGEAYKGYTDDHRAAMYRYFGGRFDYSNRGGQKKEIEPMRPEVARTLVDLSRGSVALETENWKKLNSKQPVDRESEDAKKKKEKDHEDNKLEAYNTARRHLNALQDLAFAYVHATADRETLARAVCPAMSKSRFYFGPLIAEFRADVGVSQSWQVIPEAVDMMERKFGGRECPDLYREKG